MSPEYLLTAVLGQPLCARARSLYWKKQLPGVAMGVYGAEHVRRILSYEIQTTRIFTCLMLMKTAGLWNRERGGDERAFYFPPTSHRCSKGGMGHGARPEMLGISPQKPGLDESSKRAAEAETVAAVFAMHCAVAKRCSRQNEQPPSPPNFDRPGCSFSLLRSLPAALLPGDRNAPNKAVTAEPSIPASTLHRQSNCGDAFLFYELM